ncbi:MAG TPA: hypothetical protein VGR16_15370 [Thermomicrobiales bacterium]|nr:hypothetical protein [Thermomicrobiales bacterium]
MSIPSGPRLDAIETMLGELIPRLSPAPNPRGRPEILPGALLWTGLLVCMLRKTGSQQALWRLLSQAGLWDLPQVPVTAEAVRIRLERSGPGIMQELFTQVTAELAVQFPGTRPWRRLRLASMRLTKAPSTAWPGPCPRCGRSRPGTIDSCPAS